MEWTKIKPKHYLFTDLTLANRGCLVTLISLTAHLEKMPNEHEMFTVVRRNSYNSLTLVMQKCGRSVAEVLQKVIEDCDKVDHKKKISCGTSKTYRDKQKLGDTSLDATDKIRVDKSRVDKNISSQNDVLLDAFGENLKEKILVYIDRIRLKNKSKVITEGRKNTILNELFNTKTRFNNDSNFSYAVDQAVNHDACNIGYINAIIKNKETQKP